MTTDARLPRQASGDDLTAPRRIRWIRLDEDWALVLLALVAVLATTAVMIAAIWTAQARGARLSDAHAAAGRLNVGGLDDDLHRHLFTLQQDEVTLFRSREDTPNWVSGEKKGDPCAEQKSGNPADFNGDPRDDLTCVERDLAEISDQLRSQAKVQEDVTLIGRELSRYTDLMASAGADNRQGLPVGAASLREASAYLTENTLVTADDIQGEDEKRIENDDDRTTAFPVALAVTCGVGLAALIAVQFAMARYTRRRFNLGLLAAGVLTLAVAAWSLSALSLSKHAVSRAVPHAMAAKHLALARGHATEANTYDRLIQVVHNEDCLTTAGKSGETKVACNYQNKTTGILQQGGTLEKDLAAAADGSDPRLDRLARKVDGEAEAWLADEKKLPTLYNLVASSEGFKGKNFARYDSVFLKHLDPFTAAVGVDSDEMDNVTSDYTRMESGLKKEVGGERKEYADGVDGARGDLTGLSEGALALGLLAGAAGACGVGLRLAEYWSTGRRNP